MKKKIIPIEKPQFNSAGYQVNMKDLNGELLPNLRSWHSGLSSTAGRGPARGANRRDARLFS
jgi:hypothetical protein